MTPAFLVHRAPQAAVHSRGELNVLTCFNVTKCDKMSEVAKPLAQTHPATPCERTRGSH